MKRTLWYSGIAALILLILCCAAAAAVAETSVSLQDFIPYEKGKTTVSWDVTGDEPSSYKVFVRMIENGEVSQRRVEVGRSYTHSIETTECIPGKCYEISVEDGLGNLLAQKAYRMDDAETFADGKLKNTSVKVSIETRKLEGSGDPKKTKELKAEEIIGVMGDYSTNYGIKYLMKMPTLAKERTFFVTLAFEAPNGYYYVSQATDITFRRVNGGWQELWWDFIGADFFMRMYQDIRDIPAGEYSVHLFWDGMWVNTSHFAVK